MVGFWKPAWNVDSEQVKKLKERILLSQGFNFRLFSSMKICDEKVENIPFHNVFLGRSFQCLSFRGLSFRLLKILHFLNF